MLTKVCKTCKERKDLAQFRIALISGRAKLPGTSENCIACHQSGKVPHGYGK